MNYSSETLNRFSDDLAARLPAPGGGAAAALVGSLAAALNSMVCNFTAGNERFKGVEEDIKTLLKTSEELRVELLGLLQSDVDGYSAYSAGVKETKNSALTDSEKEARREELTKQASATPLKVMKASAKVLEVCRPLYAKGNAMLLSDVEVAAVFALAALKAAFVNVRINLAYSKDEAFKSAVRKESDSLLTDSERIEKEVTAYCSAKY